MTKPGSAAFEAATGGAFQWPVRVYWEDTDAGGIVFYANYLKFFERARTEWLRHLGVEQQKLRDEVGGMFIVSSTQVQYLRPARLDDLLIVTARLSEVGRASLTIEQSVWRHDGSGPDAQAPVCLCEGSIRIGWVQATTLRPGRIPTQIIDVLSAPVVAGNGTI